MGEHWDAKCSAIEAKCDDRESNVSDNGAAAAGTDLGRVADGLERFFFGSKEFKQRLSAFLEDAAAELGEDGAVTAGAEGEGYSLRSTELHGEFVKLLERELETAALSLSGDDGPAAHIRDDDRVALIGALHDELRRRFDAGGHPDHADDGPEFDDECALLAAFPRAMLAASDFDVFSVLLRETARGHAWDMESMFGY